MCKHYTHILHNNAWFSGLLRTDKLIKKKVTSIDQAINKAMSIDQTINKKKEEALADGVIPH
jgi:hypothetical protein